MRNLFSLWLLILFFSSSFCQSQNRLLNISYGKYDVGLFHTNAKYGDSVNVLITIWQPATCQGRNRFSIRDYIAIGQPLIRQEDSIANDLVCGDNYKIDPDSLARFLDIKTSTCKESIPIDKKFPVLFWAYRHGTPHYQLAMCEYLASHGYIIFNVSRVDPMLPMPWEVDPKERLELLQLHLNDIGPMIDQIKKHPQADTSRIALLSWSYGASTAVFTQQAHPEVDLVLGFSSINFRDDFFTGQKFDSLLDPAKLKRPYILFYESTGRLGRSFNDSVFHPAHKVRSLLFRSPKMFHGNFNYMEGHAAGKLNIPKGHPWSKVGNDAVLGYEAICEFALLSLNHYLESGSKKDFEDGLNRIKRRLPEGFFY